MSYYDELRQTVINVMPVYKDYPRPGINYLNTIDICTNSRAFRNSLEFFYTLGASLDVDHIVACESRGFIWASPVAHRLGIPLYIARKKNNIPGDVVSTTYETDQGTETLELRNQPIKNGNVMVIDDVLATGRTAAAVCELVHKLGMDYGNITVACLINISQLNGIARLRTLGVQVDTLIDI